MATDSYITYYDDNGALTTVINSAAACSEAVFYAIYNRTLKQIEPPGVFDNTTDAKTAINDKMRAGFEVGALAIITVPK